MSEIDDLRSVVMNMEQRIARLEEALIEYGFMSDKPCTCPDDPEPHVHHVPVTMEEKIYMFGCYAQISNCTRGRYESAKKFFLDYGILCEPRTDTIQIPRTLAEEVLKMNYILPNELHDALKNALKEGR